MSHISGYGAWLKLTIPSSELRFLGERSRFRPDLPPRRSRDHEARL